MSGIAWYEMSTPAGNWDVNAAGRRFFSWFCRIVPEMAMPQVFRMKA